MRMLKKIKKSNRGVTFSFNGSGTKFNIGDNYKYIIDKKNNKIFIVSSNNSLKVSRKKCGSKIKSLIDLRAKKVVESFKNAEFLNVEIKENIIVVTGYVEKNNVFNEINKVYFPKAFIDRICEENEFYQLDLFDKIINSTKEKLVDKEKKGLKRAITIFSLFSGIGMLDKPFKDDKTFKIVKAVEIDSKACMSYKENIGDIIVNKDIRTLEKEDVPECDILLGGTSCKSYSQENRIRRLESHKASDLLGYYINIAKMKNFKVFVLENVVELVTLKDGKYFKQIKEDLSEFDIRFYILKDNECGGYTTRRRVFIIGSKIGMLNDYTPCGKGKTVGEALSKVDRSWYNYNDITKSSQETINRMSYVPQGGNWMNIPKNLWQPSYAIGKTHSNTFRRLKLDEPSITLANFRKCNLIHPIENRGLSVAEALAISGFNKDFRVLGSLSDKQMGIANGVPYYMGKTIKEIVKKLFINSNLILE